MRHTRIVLIASAGVLTLAAVGAGLTAVALALVAEPITWPTLAVGMTVSMLVGTLSVIVWLSVQE